MNIRMGVAALALMAGFTLSIAASAQREPAPEEMTGVKVGEKAPDFTLEAQDGKKYALSEMVKSGKTAVIFYRSASW